MRLTRCLLRYRGRCIFRVFRNCWISVNIKLPLGSIPLVYWWLITQLMHKIKTVIVCYWSVEWSFGIASSTKTLVDSLTAVEQSGAVEACWAHNPEVRRSKLRSAKCFFRLTNTRTTKTAVLAYFNVHYYENQVILYEKTREKGYFCFFDDYCIRHCEAHNWYPFNTHLRRRAPVAQSVSAPYL